VTALTTFQPDGADLARGSESVRGYGNEVTPTSAGTRLGATGTCAAIAVPGLRASAVRLAGRAAVPRAVIGSPLFNRRQGEGPREPGGSGPQPRRSR
jgi:hypothetical protein